jgi:pyruvate dehydrogenase E2 component (dihydrolipoamide acetyltransferase)
MPDNFNLIPLTPIRKLIAARMSEGAREIPLFRLAIDIEVDGLIELRARLTADRPEAKLSLNDMLIKVCADALMDEPGINIQWAATEIRQYASANIAVVMAVEGGLSTPIIREANLKSIWDIAREVRVLGERAKNKMLKVNEIVGGSFSISNLGMFGVDRFDALINPPQCAILAVGAAKIRPVATETCGWRVATLMTATLSCDHRAIDGVTGAKFLAALRRRLEAPQYLQTQAAHLPRHDGSP